MAEGDTILRAARRLERGLAGKAVRVRTPNPRGRAAGVERLDGMTVEAVRAHGKNLIVEFGELSLHSHLGMNGSWHVYGAGERRRGRPARPGSCWPPRTASRRSSTAARPCGSSPPGRCAATPPWRGSAPTSSPRASTRATRSACSAERPGASSATPCSTRARSPGSATSSRARPASPARLDPWLPVGELSDEDLERVLLAARRLMLDAAESRRHPYATYRRAGRPCPRCGTPIRSRGQGDDNRTTYWCPHCQAVSEPAGPGTNAP